jgi:hypothetical protein
MGFNHPVGGTFDVASHSDRAAMQAIQRGELRGICAKRKRTLKKRGVRVFWSTFLGSWAWNPKESSHD